MNMNLRSFALVTCLLVASPALPQTRMIDAGGLKLRAQIEGQAREGQPTVVLVGGLGDSLEIWRLVQPAVAQFARVVAYDRAGLGQSEPDTAPPTPQRISTQLHTLLQNAGIKPPYVLVGHSIGGPHIRMFAAQYPGEVAGLVYVDPSDFTQTRDDQIAIWNAFGIGEAGLKAQEQQFTQQFAEKPAAIRAEAEVSLQLNQSGWKDFAALPPVPDIPVVVLMAAKIDLPPQVKAVIGKQRMEHLAKWTVEGSKGTFLITSRSDHYIHSSEPELVAWAIKRVLAVP
jgi:pimeloyl-ACP methyl ester carboxylesterase